jgi:hypothetical protein
MDKKRTVQRKKVRKKGGPKLKFKLGTIFTICLLSFLLCFLIYMINVNTDDTFLDKEFGTSLLISDAENDDTVKESEVDTVSEAEDTAFSNPVPQSLQIGDEYFTGCSLITDGTLAEMGGFGFAKEAIYGGTEYNLAAVTTIKQNSAFGNLSPYEIIKQKKPSALYLMFGAEIETTEVDAVISEYSKLINSLKSTVPDTKIYVMEFPPVIYDTDELSNEKINDFNSKLINMCNDAGIYCIDTNTALKSESSKLDEKYWSYETLSLSEAGYNKVVEYILTHVVQ